MDNKLLSTDQLLTLYAGRQDVIGVRDSGGWRCIRPENGQYHSVIDDHASGRTQAAVYPLLDDGTVRFAVVDVDTHGDADVDLVSASRVLAFRISDRLRTEGIHSYVSRSKSGGGNFHIDLFFGGPVQASRVRRLLHSIVDGELARLQSEGKRAPNVEIIPKQDRLTDGSIGSSIALPHFPPCVANGTTVFIDRDGWECLPVIQKNDPAILERAAARVPSPRQSSQSSLDVDSFFGAVPVGARHNQLTRIVGYLKGKRIPQGEALAIVTLWNNSLPAPLPEAEIRQTVQSLFKGVVSKSFDLFRGHNMHVMPISEAPNLLGGIFRSKSVGFLAGEEGSGKSLLAMNLGVAVATAAPDFLIWKIEHPGPVIFLNNELAFEDVVRRFQSMTRTLPGRGSLDNFICPKEVPPLSECFDILNDLCAAEKPVLVVLDCLYFAHDEDENDSSKMKDLMRQLQSIRDMHNTCVVVVHHLKKGGREQRLNSELMRGAGVFGSIADSIIMLRRSQTDEVKRILKPTKLRHFPDGNKAARLLSLNPENLWFYDQGEVQEDDHISIGPTAQDVLDIEAILEGGPLRFGDILEKCKGYGFASKTIQRQIDDLVTAGKVVKPKYGFYALPDWDMVPE